MLSNYYNGFNLLSWVPERYKRKNSPMRRILLSVTNEIHRQIGELKRQKKKPAFIKLGPVCSVRFCYEQNRGNIRISDGPREYLEMPVKYRYHREGVFVLPKIEKRLSGRS